MTVSDIPVHRGDRLTDKNYTLGFMVDSEVIGGVCENPEQAGVFLAFLIKPVTNEPISIQAFSTLDEALGAINKMERHWVFQNMNGACCGNTNADGSCEGHET